MCSECGKVWVDPKEERVYIGVCDKCSKKIFKKELYK